MGLTGALLWSSSCSLVYDLSPDQCGATAECTGKFGSGYVCEAGLCRKTGSSGGRSSGGAAGSGGSNSGGGASGGRTNGGTSAGGTAGASAETGGSGGVPVEPECSTHAECLDLYGDVDPRACVQGTCVPLKSDECPLLLPMKSEQWLDSLQNSNALIFGVYSPVPEASLLSNYTRFSDLAVTEVTEEVMGLPGPGGKRRQIVMVVCDGGTPSTDELRASASHLFDELKVPGVVSNLQSADLQFVFEEYAQQSGAFVMSALDADDAILNLQDSGRVWTMLAGPDQVAATVPPLLDRTIEYLRASTSLATGAVRVALVAPTGEPRLLGDMGEAIRKTIRFNDKSAADNFPDNFTVIDIETVYGDAAAAEDQSKVISELLAFKPHVVLAMAANEFFTNVIPGLESQWTESAPGQARPFYILSPYHLGATSSLNQALAAVPSVRTRLVGVAYAAAEDRSVYQDYIIRFDQAYPEVRTDASRLGLENFYDAPYYLLYAAAAAGNPAELTGDLLAKGMSRLIKGSVVYEIGRDQMVEAFGLLQANAKNTFTLKGTLGLANFDEGSGARNDGGSVFCIDKGNKFAPDILRWDSASETFSDAATPIGDACIQGF